MTALAGCLATGGPGRAGAQARAPALPPDDAAVKADYVQKFLGYVDWPASAYAGPDAPHVVAVLRADDVLGALEQLAAGGRSGGARTRPLVVRRVAAGDALAGVHVLLVGRGARPADAALLRAQPTLVVTDTPTGLADYAMLNFITVDRRVRFEAAPAAAERAGLKLNARLLAVAARVSAP